MVKMPLPKSNWNCREILDAREIYPLGFAACQFCGTKIRWIHVLEHDDHFRPMHAGCCCAARLCNGYDAAGAEREMKNRLSRRMTFVDRSRWRQSRNNPANIWRFVRISDQRLRVTVFMTDIGQFGIAIFGRDSNEYPNWDRYGSQPEAMHRAFQMVQELKRKAASAHNTDEVGE
jgi:hypothetical protein